MSSKNNGKITYSNLLCSNQSEVTIIIRQYKDFGKLYYSFCS